MNALKFTEYSDAVGQGYIELRKHNKFPDRGWSCKTVGNVIYILARPSLKYITFYCLMTKLERKTGKQVEWCPVPKGFLKLAV